VPDRAPAAELPRGLIIELLTPLDRRGGVDLEAAGRLLDHVAPFAEGLLLFGPEVGLGPDLGIRARVELLSFLAPRTALPLLVFITARDRKTTEGCLEAIGSAADPARLILVDAPLLVRSNRDLIHWTGFLSDCHPAPVILYNHPRLMDRLAARTKRRNIRTAVLKKLIREVPGPAGLIFQGDFKRLLNYHRAVRERSAFRIYDAAELRFLDRPSAYGVVSAGANLLPAAWSRVVRAALRQEQPGSLAELLACGRGLRALALRTRGRARELILAGLTGLGLVQGGPGPQGPEPDQVLSFLEGLDLRKWGLLPRGLGPAQGGSGGIG